MFYFSYRYVRKPGVKATFFTHDNKLELIWTIVPAIVMAVIIILGLRSWNELTSGPTKDSEKIELFAEQFQWTARYSGEDNVLGKFDYKLTTGTNGLGLMTKATIDSSISEITNSIQKIELSLKLMHLDHLSSFYRNKVRSSSYKNAVETHIPANVYQPKRVENQCTSIDINQSHDEVELNTAKNTKNNAPRR